MARGERALKLATTRVCSVAIFAGGHIGARRRKYVKNGSEEQGIKKQEQGEN
jgi:hypothetical protein